MSFMDNRDHRIYGPALLNFGGWRVCRGFMLRGRSVRTCSMESYVQALSGKEMGHGSYGMELELRSKSR